MKIIPVILSGGSGTRLWPLSRKQYPKQFLPFLGNKTMFQETILRLKGIENIVDPIIICNSNHRFIVAEQLQEIGIINSTILLEPTGRNTAPAIAAAALQVFSGIDNTDATLLVLPADHIIQNIKAFHKAIYIAEKQARAGKIVTFGVVPSSPNTGYGYINFSREINQDVYKVEHFVEKPDKKTAESYLKKGNYLWNSGIFMFQAEIFINELSVHCIDILHAVKKSFENATQDLDFIRLEAQAFASSQSDSVDYAVMEKSNNVVVIPLDVGWSDIGSWSSLYEISEKDKNSNVIKGDVFTEETNNCYIYAGHHMVATIGVEDLVIIDTPNATMIAHKDKSQDVQKIVQRLQKLEREEQLHNRKVYRPWGWYDSIESGKHFQVKKLHVNPGAKLSLQKHHKRAEHWVVVNGTATVTNGESCLTLTEGESTYIPVGTIHALENKTNQALEIVEVQSGIYLGEDDIIRFEDIYGRVNEKSK